MRVGPSSLKVYLFLILHDEMAARCARMGGGVAQASRGEGIIKQQPHHGSKSSARHLIVMLISGVGSVAQQCHGLEIYSANAVKYS